MPNYQSPTQDLRPSELRSIAKSVEPAFPTAAIALREIAASLDSEDN